MEENREVRCLRVEELRAEDIEGAAPKIIGTPAVYNQPSEDLGGFTEVIEPGFFELVLGGDIRSLWNHNTDYPLGRTTNDTLRLMDGLDGLHVEIEPPATSWGRDAVESVRRGDVDGMSFMFTVKKDGDRWESENGKTRRTLLRGGCERLYEVSPVTFPAYPQTTAAVRKQFEEIQREQHDASQADAAGGGQEAAGKDARRKTAHRLELAKRSTDRVENYQIKQGERHEDNS